MYEFSPPVLGCKCAEGLDLFPLYPPILERFKETLRVHYPVRLLVLSSSSAGLDLGKFVKVRRWSSFALHPFPTLSACVSEDLGLWGPGNLCIKGVKDFMYYLLGISYL